MVYIYVQHDIFYLILAYAIRNKYRKIAWLLRHKLYFLQKARSVMVPKIHEEGQTKNMVKYRPLITLVKINI